MQWGVVANKDHFNALEGHHPVRFGPTAVITKGHSHDPVERCPDAKPIWALFEISSFQMLKWSIWFVFFVPRQVNLAVPANYRPISLNQN
jgi:hypothetical protein